MEKHFRVIVLSDLTSDDKTEVAVLMLNTLIEVNHFVDPVEAMNDTAKVRKHQTVLGVVAMGENSVHPDLELMTIQLRPDEDIYVLKIESDIINNEVLNSISRYFKNIRIPL